VRFALHPQVVTAMEAIVLVLAVATIVTWVVGRLITGARPGERPGERNVEIRRRIRSWWVIVAIFFVALALNRTGSLVFFGLVSFLALKEYLSLIPTRRSDRRVLLLAYLSIPVQYLWVGLEWYGMFIIFIPVYMLLYLPARMVIIGETEGFLRSAGTIHWGLMMTVFSVSHVAYLLALPAAVNPVGGGAALVLYLVLLTEVNDVAQFLWGKSTGRRRVVPTVSPNKTWGGLLGGVGTTLLLGTAIASWLTPFTGREALGAALLIGVSGFIGDVVISAVKRDLGIKDSGTMLPGHGGILDRIDSLTYTAPLFFHYVRYLHG
jgi:phosphatidate cytidylyltransferase